jgi:hypothetical protein
MAFNENYVKMVNYNSATMFDLDQSIGILNEILSAEELEQFGMREMESGSQLFQNINAGHEVTNKYTFLFLFKMKNKVVRNHNLQQIFIQIISTRKLKI